MIKISDILPNSCVRVPLEATDKTAVITELVNLLAASGQLLDSGMVLQAVLKREQILSTGIGEGLAVPHGKSAGCSILRMAVGKPASPLDFGSIDGRPCELVVLLASPVDITGPHVQALARISRLWQNGDFRIAVASAATAEALYAAIEQYQE